MMLSNPRMSLAAAMALIVVANAIVLVGVAYNRGGEPESVLQLNERELEMPHAWGLAAEKSAIGLELAWRVISPEEERAARGLHGYGQDGRVAGWLTPGKLRELGFKLPAADATDDALHRHDREMEVYLALEMDGDTYQEAVRAARQNLSQLEAKGKGQSNYAERLKRARLALQREQTSQSRLFAVDAGLDPQVLRARYPDRKRYAVVAGRIKPWLGGTEGKRTIWGYITALSVERISVPYDFRPILEGVSPTRNYGDDVQSPRFEATVAYGRRLEPWITSAKRIPGAK